MKFLRNLCLSLGVAAFAQAAKAESFTCTAFLPMASQFIALAENRISLDDIFHTFVVPVSRDSAGEILPAQVASDKGATVQVEIRKWEHVDIYNVDFMVMSKLNPKKRDIVAGHRLYNNGPIGGATEFDTLDSSGTVMANSFRDALDADGISESDLRKMKGDEVAKLIRKYIANGKLIADAPVTFSLYAPCLYRP